MLTISRKLAFILPLTPILIITSAERDPNSALPPPIIGGYKPAVIGEEPPAFIGLEDLCPPAPKCQDCDAVRCEGSARMYGLTILPYQSSLPGLPNRTQGN